VTVDADKIHQRRWWTLGVLCLSLLLIVVDNSIVNVALPTIQQDLDSSTSQLQWIVDSYILVFAGLLLTAGSLGDKFGRKGALNAGLGIMALAAALSAVAESSGQLIATRAVMGIGAALVMPATLSILTNVFTDPGERAKAIAIWAGTSGMAVALGPVSGGWLLEHFWWGSVFLVNIPVIAAALVGGYFLVPHSRDEHATRIDLVGAGLSIVGLVSLVWAVIKAGELGWTDGTVLSGFAVAALFLTLFVVAERRIAEPMLPVSFFASRRFTAASAAITVTFFAMMGAIFLLTQYQQLVLGYSALGVGVRLLPMAAVMMVMAPTSAKLVERAGTKAVVGTGLLITSLSLVLLATLDAGSSYAALVSRMMLLAAGMALTFSPATESIMGSLPREKAGVGSAINDTTREVGGALGIALLGSLMSGRYTDKMATFLADKPVSPADAHVIADNLRFALGAAGQAGGENGQLLASTAKDAFVDGMALANLVGAVAVLVGAIVVFAFLPARAQGVDPVLEADVDTPADTEVAGDGDDPSRRPAPVLA
jgi:EmrB/QacA subfamily drug resistance transporter